MKNRLMGNTSYDVKKNQTTNQQCKQHNRQAFVGRTGFPERLRLPCTPFHHINHRQMNVH